MRQERKYDRIVRRKWYEMYENVTNVLHKDAFCCIIRLQIQAVSEKLAEVFDLRFMERTYKENPIQNCLLAGIIAIELLMSFSFLGYLHIKPISITFAYIPVLLAGCILGPVSSALVGAIFGLASLWKASASYVLPADQIFSPFLSGDPIGSLFVSLGSRILFGFLVGILYRVAKRARRYVGLWIGLVSAIGRILHSILVYTFIGVFFPEMGFHIGSAFEDFGALNNILTSLMTVLIVVGAYMMRKTVFFKRFEQQMRAVRNLQIRKTRSFFPVIVTAIFTLIAALSIAWYFVQRMSQVLKASGYALNEIANYDLLHLQVQFLLGILSLTFLVVLCLFFVYQHTTYLRYEAQMDTLTGIMNRNGFVSFCEHVLKNLHFSEDQMGYFLILDVDHFKRVNDSMGHPKGDEVLCKVAQCMQSVLNHWGIVGRMGGDEFAALLYTPMKQKDMEELMNHFMDCIHQIVGSDNTLSCSIGVMPFYQADSLQKLYESADRCLYKAKSQGRDQYCIGEIQGKS